MKIAEQHKVNEELHRLSFENENNDQNVVQPGVYPLLQEKYLFDNDKKWSFGILYVPYYSGTSYTVLRQSGYPTEPEVYSNVENQTNFEAQLTYSILSDLKIFLMQAIHPLMKTQGMKFINEQPVMNMIRVVSIPQV